MRCLLLRRSGRNDGRSSRSVRFSIAEPDRESKSHCQSQPDRQSKSHSESEPDRQSEPDSESKSDCQSEPDRESKSHSAESRF